MNPTEAPSARPRAAALTVLTRAARAGEAPRGTGDALARALADPDPGVRTRARWSPA
ncbi:hypothetical protein [Actinomadura madurae]|uniref:hypothetical protein n=1 Tax=Actinomadura madurae TaxID=1993 RepID=UPI0015A62DA4|nr:hypothetical protein [Actinomadura madurae]